MLKIYQIIWDDDAKADFAFWIKTDKLIVKRIESLTDSIENNPEQRARLNCFHQVFTFHFKLTQSIRPVPLDLSSPEPFY